MSNGDDLSTDVVVKSVDTVGVDKTISDPTAGLYRLLNVTQDLSVTSVLCQ